MNKGFPVIDLHCHLEGSIDPDISFRILRRLGFPAADSRRRFLQKVQGFLPDRGAFFNAVSLLDKCLINRSSVIKVTSDIIKRAADQNVKILELSLAPRGFQLRREKKGNLDLFFEAVLEGVRKGTAGRDIAVGLKFLVLPRHLSGEFHATYGDIQDIIRDYRPHLVGVDICTLDPLIKEGHRVSQISKICYFVRNIGLHLSAHAGEFLSAQPMAEAIRLGVERIGHGIQVVNRKDIADAVIANNIPLEVCPVSNYRTGTITALKKHPLRKLIRMGMKVTINSDDPSVQGSNWGDDYRIAEQEIGLTEQEIRRCLEVSFETSFLDSAVKANYQKYFSSKKSGMSSGSLQNVG